MVGMLMLLRKPSFVAFAMGLVLILSACGVAEDSTTRISNLQGKKMTVYHSPTCSCCKEYVQYLEKKGVDVKSIERGRYGMRSIKRRHGLSRDSASCHTGVIGDYVVEGHVPARTISKLLAENPSDLKGITIPGMPRHAPGMGGPIGEDLTIQSFDESGRLTGTFDTVRY